MTKAKLPKTDSIKKLAAFWDRHDLTDFEDQLEAVPGSVFVRTERAAAIRVPLEQREAAAIDELARAKGVSREQLVREWVIRNLARRGNGRGRPPR